MAIREPPAAGPVRPDQRRDRRPRRRRRPRHRHAGEPGVGGDLRLRQRRPRPVRADADLGRDQRGLRLELAGRWPISTRTATSTCSTATATRSTTRRRRDAAWNGLQWLENTGRLTFALHRIADFPARRARRPRISMATATWTSQSSAPTTTGRSPRRRAWSGSRTTGRPLHACTSRERADASRHAGDRRLHGDGRPDLVTGGMHVSGPTIGCRASRSGPIVGVQSQPRHDRSPPDEPPRRQRQCHGRPQTGRFDSRIAIAGAALVAWFAAGELTRRAQASRLPALPDLSATLPAVRSEVIAADRAARAQPSSATAIGDLGIVCHASLLTAQALQLYAIAASLDGADRRWPYYQGLLLEERGDHERAGGICSGDDDRAWMTGRPGCTSPISGSSAATPMARLTPIGASARHRRQRQLLLAVSRAECLFRLPRTANSASRGCRSSAAHATRPGPCSIGSCRLIRCSDPHARCAASCAIGPKGARRGTKARARTARRSARRCGGRPLTPSGDPAEARGACGPRRRQRRGASFSPGARSRPTRGRSTC